jgi:hypothetical protein
MQDVGLVHCLIVRWSGICFRDCAANEDMAPTAAHPWTPSRRGFQSSGLSDILRVEGYTWIRLKRVRHSVRQNPPKDTIAVYGVDNCDRTTSAIAPMNLSLAIHISCERF